MSRFYINVFYKLSTLVKAYRHSCLVLYINLISKKYVKLFILHFLSYILQILVDLNYN